MIDTAVVEDFFAQRRIAVVGVSDEKNSFARAVFCELRRRGYETFSVHPTVDTVDGEPCYPDLASVPRDVEIDGVIVMVNRATSAAVVQQCIDRRIRRVWLFKGLGGSGSVSDEAVALCRDNGIAVIEGACPFMFLAPVGTFHRVHRAFRRLNGSVGKIDRPIGRPITTDA
jgi:predicted CoA-binding protein